MSDLQWGNQSKAEKSTIHPDLNRVLDHALDTGIIDMTIVQGRRGHEEQNRYYNEGKSKVQWPNSKHNVLVPTDLAKAVDVVPFISGKGKVWDKSNCLVMVGVLMSSAFQLGIKIRSGSNWDQDQEYVTDQDFQDLAHIELVEE